MKLVSPSNTAICGLVLFLAACGGGSGSSLDNVDGGPGGGNGSCTALSLGELSADQTPGWYVAEVKNSNLVNAFLRIELNPKNKYAFKPETINLATPPNDNYSTCTHCVMLVVQGAMSEEAKSFFQSAGSMTLEKVSNPPNGSSKGSVSGVDLIQVTVDSKGVTKAVTGGTCYSVPKLSWDTTASTGTVCDTSEDCANPETEVCDPATAKCVPGQCDGAGHPCAGTKVCVAQSEASGAGACYDGCTPFGASSCASTEECVVLTYDQKQGTCYKKGSGAEGESCKFSQVNTSCASGLRCVLESSGTFCRKACDLLSGKNVCPTGQACIPGSYCSADPVDPAKVGEDCGPDAFEGSSCAVVSGSVKGVCASNATGYKCSQICRMSTATDCTAPQVCMDYFGSLGICN